MRLKNKKQETRSTKRNIRTRGKTEPINNKTKKLLINKTNKIKLITNIGKKTNKIIKTVVATKVKQPKEKDEKEVKDNNKLSTCDKDKQPVDENILRDDKKTDDEIKTVDDKHLVGETSSKVKKTTKKITNSIKKLVKPKKGQNLIKETGKISKELLNLSASYNNQDKTPLIKENVECKTSICEMVKTKSRSVSKSFDLDKKNEKKLTKPKKDETVVKKIDEKKVKKIDESEKPQTEKKKKKTVEVKKDVKEVEKPIEVLIENKTELLEIKENSIELKEKEVVLIKSEDKKLVNLAKKNLEKIKKKIKDKIIPKAKKVVKEPEKSNKKIPVKKKEVAKKSEPEKVLKTEKGKISVKSIESLQEPSLLELKEIIKLERELKETKEKELLEKETQEIKETNLKSEETSKIKKLKTIKDSSSIIKRKYIKKITKTETSKELPTTPLKFNDFKKDIYDFNESGTNSDTANDDAKSNPIYKRKMLSKIELKSEQMPSTSADPLEIPEPTKIKKLNVVKKIYNKIKKPQILKTKLKTIFEENEDEKDEKDVKKIVKNKKTKISESENSESEHSSNHSGNSAVTRIGKESARNRRMKLYGFWSGPKRHRMASLNAQAKVQCLYENEARSAHELGLLKVPQLPPTITKDKTKLAQIKTEQEDKNKTVEVGDKQVKKIEKKTVEDDEKNNQDEDDDDEEEEEEEEVIPR